MPGGSSCARRDARLTASNTHLDNDLNLRCARTNGGLAKCLITISMEIPSRDRGRRVRRASPIFARDETIAARIYEGERPGTVKGTKGGKDDEKVPGGRRQPN